MTLIFTALLYYSKPPLCIPPPIEKTNVRSLATTILGKKCFFSPYLTITAIHHYACHQHHHLCTITALCQAITHTFTVCSSIFTTRFGNKTFFSTHYHHHQSNLLDRLVHHRRPFIHRLDHHQWLSSTSANQHHPSSTITTTR